MNPGLHAAVHRGVVRYTSTPLTVSVIQVSVGMLQVHKRNNSLIQGYIAHCLFHRESSVIDSLASALGMDENGVLFNVFFGVLIYI